jgi:hypothetical protein
MMAADLKAVGTYSHNTIATRNNGPAMAFKAWQNVV